MTTLRIAHITNEPFGAESANGIQQVVYSLASAQVKIGQSVAVFSREGGVHVLEDAVRAALPRFAPGSRPGGTLRQRFLSRYVDHRFAADVLAWQPDIVHLHSVHIPQNVALAAHLGRAAIPYCVTTHGGLFRAALQRNRLKKLVFRLLLEGRYLNDAAFIHAVSPHETEALQRYGVQQPVVVIRNGVPANAEVPASDPDALFAVSPGLRGRRIFMFVGRLDPWQKGLDLVVEAFARAQLRNATLVLVGPDHRGSKAGLAALGERLGISSQVLFTGPAFGRDRSNLLAAADVFVHASRWEGGLSLAVLAATVAGKPCLLTRAADPLGELERAQAALIVDGSVPSIADGLKRASTLSRNELQLMGARARQVAQSGMTWPAIAEELLAAYRVAVGGRGEGVAYVSRPGPLEGQ
jgi:glycosyltransferase involved in cell wall biosynthesis